ncbi:hypothetical protein ACLHDD_15605 [Pantoea sp. NSTU24]
MTAIGSPVSLGHPADAAPGHRDKAALSGKAKRYRQAIARNALRPG